MQLQLYGKKIWLCRTTIATHNSTFKSVNLILMIF